MASDDLTDEEDFEGGLQRLQRVLDDAGVPATLEWAWAEALIAAQIFVVRAGTRETFEGAARAVWLDIAEEAPRRHPPVAAMQATAELATADMRAKPLLTALLAVLKQAGFEHTPPTACQLLCNAATILWKFHGGSDEWDKLIDLVHRRAERNLTASAHRAGRIA